MQSERVRVRLGDCVELLTGFPFKSASYSSNASDVRLLRGDNVAQGVLRWDDAKRWPNNQLANLSEFALQADDIVLAMDRPWIAAGLKFAHVRQPDLPCFLVQRVARLRAREVVDARFLRYIIGSQAFTEHVLSIETGTAVPHISGRQIAGFEFDLPPKSEQESIGLLLGILDDRIDLLRQTNTTLESIAQTLFKSWFIDFDPVHAKAEGREPDGMDAETATLFPDSFDESELGKIPKGWRIGTLGKVAWNPRSQAKPGQTPLSTPYIGLEHMPRKSIALDKMGTAEGLESGKFWFEFRDILFGKLRPYFHKVGMAPCKGVCSTDILVIRPRETSWLAYVAMHASSEELIAHTTRLSNGARMPRTSWRDVEDYAVVLPDERCVHAFNDILSPLIDRIFTNMGAMILLRDLRDALLPPLISGKLRLPDASKQIEEVIAC